MDGQLENLWRGDEIQKKISRKGEVNEHKFMHAN